MQEEHSSWTNKPNYLLASSEEIDEQDISLQLDSAVMVELNELGYSFRGHRRH